MERHRQSTLILKNKAQMASQSLKKSDLPCMLIQTRPVGKHPVVINTEIRFTVIGKVSEWQSHKTGTIQI